MPLFAYGHFVHHEPVCGAASEAPFVDGLSEEQGTALLLQDAPYAEHASTALEG
jgi:hypothetical protein